jgi:hypothetical protein
MISGLSVRRMMGVKWVRRLRNCLGAGVDEAWMRVLWAWEMEAYKMTENEAVAREARKIRGIVQGFQSVRVAMMSVSLMKLMDGGAEMFVAVKRNHHRVREGKMLIRPLKAMRLRVWCCR